MRRPIAFVPIAAALISVTLAAAAAAQAPVAIAPPPEPYLSYLIDEATGAPTPLEAGWTKPERTGRSYLCYLEGAASPVVLAANQRHRFVITVGGLKTQPNIENWKALNKLERLQVGDKGRRYATKMFVPTDVTPSGEVTSTLDKKGKPLYWITLIYTPREPLPPGEYAFSASGLFEPAGFAPRNGQAFQIR